MIGWAKPKHNSCLLRTESMQLFQLPSGEATCVMWADFVIGWPFRFMLRFTIPDCKTQAWRKWYMVTFVMCVVWNTGLCYLVSWMTTVIGKD